MKQLISEVPSELFVSPHKSFLVNLNHISSIEKNEIFLDDGEMIPISRAFKKALITRATQN